MNLKKNKMGIFLDLVNEYLGIQKAAHNARKPYQWGAKEYLSGFKVGERKNMTRNSYGHPFAHAPRI